MKPIKEYEIITHGVMYSDYFQGCGTCGTEFENVATGIGNSEYNALSDAVEQLVQGDWDVDGNPDLLNDIDRASEVDMVLEQVEEFNIPEDGEWPWVYVSVLVR